MKRVTISVTFDCDDKTAKMAENMDIHRLPSAYTMNYFAVHSLNASLMTTVRIEQLFGVITEDRGVTTNSENFICFPDSSPMTYTRGIAIKKARAFKGTVKTLKD